MLQAADRIYRCEQDDRVVFSDLPCSEKAEPYEPSARLSVVGASADLEVIRARNRKFIDAREERLRDARARRRAAGDEPRARTIVREVPIPVAVRPRFGIDRPSGPQSEPDPRRERARQQSRAEADRPPPRVPLPGGGRPRSAGRGADDEER